MVGLCSFSCSCSYGYDVVLCGVFTRRITSCVFLDWPKVRFSPYFILFRSSNSDFFFRCQDHAYSQPRRPLFLYRQQQKHTHASHINRYAPRMERQKISIPLPTHIHLPHPRILSQHHGHLNLHPTKRFHHNPTLKRNSSQLRSFSLMLDQT